MSLQFDAMDMESGAGGCYSEYLKIEDGDGTTLMERICGSTDYGDVYIGNYYIGSSLPPLITSTSNVVKFHFFTDYYDSGNSGWSVTWSSAPAGTCQ